jgi:hypothetical protein
MKIRERGRIAPCPRAGLHLLYMEGGTARLEAQAVFLPERRADKSKGIARNGVCAKKNDLYGEVQT